MRILILCGSPRRNGNSDLLAESFAMGAATRNEVNVIRVADLNIHPCTGCERCLTSEGNRCVVRDDMHIVYGMMSMADMLVVSSPVYFYGVSAQLKAAIDRFHAPMRNGFPVRKTALMLVGAAGLPDLFDPILLQYDMLTRFFDLEDCGRILVRGIRGKGDVRNDPSLREAYELGLSAGDGSIGGH